MCFQPEIQGADLVSLKYCTASAHQVSCGEVRLEPQLLADAGCETPAINYKRFNGRKYRCQDIFDIWIPRLSFINISWFPFKIFQQSLLFRYFYAISSDVAIEHPGRLVKVDTKTSKVKPVTVESYVSLKSLQVESWSEDNCYCSEPVYIAEPAEAREDSGLLICSLLWGKPRVTTTAILVLRAQDLSPIARLKIFRIAA